AWDLLHPRQVSAAEHLVPTLVMKPNGCVGGRRRAFGADVTLSSHEFEYAFSMQLRYNYRLDPRPRHRAAFVKAFGCARVVFNDPLAVRDAARDAGPPDRP